MQMFMFIRKDFEIKVTKVDDGSFHFTTEFEYMKWAGSSFLKDLSFVEDFQAFLQSGSIEIKLFPNHILILISVPFSSKVESIVLNKPLLTKIEELKVEIKKQDAKIEALEVRLNSPELAILNLYYTPKRGCWIDYDSFLNSPGTNADNLKLVVQMMEESVTPYKGAFESIDEFLSTVGVSAESKFNILKLQPSGTEVIKRIDLVKSLIRYSPLLSTPFYPVCPDNYRVISSYVCNNIVDKVPVLRWVIPRRTVSFVRISKIKNKYGNFIKANEYYSAYANILLNTDALPTEVSTFVADYILY